MNDKLWTVRFKILNNQFRVDSIFPPGAERGLWIKNASGQDWQIEVDADDEVSAVKRAGELLLQGFTKQFDVLTRQIEVTSA